MKKIVFHVISEEDTKDFSIIYENLPGVEVYINPEKSDVIGALGDNPEADIIAIGHGDQQGLYDMTFGGCVIDNEVVPLLRGRFVIGIWCFASEFADRFDLKGFFTSDFISNSMELYNRLGIDNIEEEVIQANNKAFSMRLYELIRNNVAPSSWVKKLQDDVSEFSTPIEKYNYEALSYYE